MHNPTVGGSGHGETPGDATAFELVKTDLTSALASVIANASSREEIRHGLAPVCARIRKEKMDVAELVKVVKQIFAGTVVGARLNGGERQQLLDRIISVCIDEYYAAD